MKWTDEGFCSFDFETSGSLPEYALQPWRLASGDFWATSLVWVWREDGVLHTDGGLNPDRPMMARFLAFLKRTVRRGVGWNTVFDLSVLAAYGFEDEIMALQWVDGMLLYRHLEVEPEYEINKPDKRPFRLKGPGGAMSVFYPDEDGYEEDVDYHDPDPAVRAKLHDYNVKDSIFTLRITRKLWARLTKQQLRNALIEAECLPMIARANVEGMIIDTLACRDLITRLEREADDALAKLQWFGVTEEIIRSPTKLAELIFDQWKLPVFKTSVGKKTGKVSRSTDKEVLHELSFIDPKVKTLRTYREALNNKTKFADAPLESVLYNGDGRAHPLARVFGTYSGRLTYSSKQGRNKDERQIGFALHQEKREGYFRSIVVPPDGFDLMEFDAAGQEYRWMAVASGDTVMMQLCLPGEDPHSFMGARCASQDYKTMMVAAKVKGSKEADIRQMGKVGNLSLQYRTSAPKLCVVARVQHNIPMQLPQAKLIHSTYQRTYVKVPIYWRNQIARTKACGYVETLAGRRVTVQGDWSGTMGWSMGSTSINFRIQGTGADQKYLAMACIKDYVHSIGGRFAWDLHDGIYIYVPKSKTKEAARVIKQLLDNLPYKQAWGFTPPIPMPWDVKVGPSWGHLKEYDVDA
jgi:DNA polymerase I-like protein with 3'-5' exonuclease and polymerase domains